MGTGVSHCWYPDLEASGSHSSVTSSNTKCLKVLHYVKFKCAFSWIPFHGCHTLEILTYDNYLNWHLWSFHTFYSIRLFTLEMTQPWTQTRVSKRANVISCKEKKGEVMLQECLDPGAKWYHQNLGSLQFSSLHSSAWLHSQAQCMVIRLPTAPELYFARFNLIQTCLLSLSRPTKKVILHFIGSDWFTYPSLNQSCRPGKKWPFYPTPQTRVAPFPPKTHGVRVGRGRDGFPDENQVTTQLWVGKIIVPGILPVLSRICG